MNAPPSDVQAGGGASTTGTLNGFYAYRNTFDEDSVWLDIPKQSNIFPDSMAIESESWGAWGAKSCAVTFVNTTNPYADDLHYLASPYHVAERIPHLPQQQHDWSRTGLDQGGGTASGLEALSAAALRMPNSAANASEDLADFESLHSIPDLDSHEEAAPTTVDSNFPSMSGNDINSDLPARSEHIATAIDPALEVPYPAMHSPPDVSESSPKKPHKGPP